MERLATAIPPVEDQSKYLRDLAGGFEKGQIFLTALELDLFTLLETPRTCREVAETLETLPHITNRFLDVLVGMGLVAKNEKTYVTASSVAPFLAKDAPYAARYLNFASKSRGTWMKLAETMKTGPVDKVETSRPCL